MVVLASCATGLRASAQDTVGLPFHEEWDTYSATSNRHFHGWYFCKNGVNDESVVMRANLHAFLTTGNTEGSGTVVATPYLNDIADTLTFYLYGSNLSGHVAQVEFGYIPDTPPIATPDDICALFVPYDTVSLSVSRQWQRTTVALAPYYAVHGPAHRFALRLTNSFGQELYLDEIGAHKTLEGSGACLHSTNVGNDFWAGFVLNGSPQNTYEAAINLTAQEACTVTVTCPFSATPTRTLNLAAGSSGKVLVAQASDGVYEEHIEVFGFHITSTAPVQAVASWSKLASSGATNLLPTATLGRHYRIADYPTDGGRINSGSAAAAVVIATENMTTVSYTPPVEVKESETGIVHPAGQPVSLVIGQAHGHHRIICTAPNTSLSGMEITANKTVAVFQGNQICGIPHSTPSGDYIYEQALPVDQWGTDYAAVPTGTRSVGDVVRLVADAACTVSISSTGQSISMAAGDVREVPIAVNQPTLINSTAPISAAFCTKGSDYLAEPGDASMLMLPSLDRAVRHAIFSTIRTERIFNQWFVTLVSDSPTSMTLDGNPIASYFQPIGSTGYHWAQIAVGQGTHTVDNAEGEFVGWTYGIGNVDCYTYSLGHCYEWETPYVPETHHDTIHFSDTVCQGQEYRLPASFTVGGQTCTPPSEGRIHIGAAETSRPGTLERWSDWVEDDTLVHHICLTLTVLPETRTTISNIIIAGDTLFFADTAITLAGTYTFRYARTGQCDSVVTLVVSIQEASLAASADGVCPGEEVVLTGSGSHVYNWSATPPDTTLAALQGQNPISVHPQQTTTYTLLDAGGGTIASITVGVEPPPALCVESNRSFIDFDHPILILKDCSLGHYRSEWNFSDGARFTGEHIRHRFAHPLPDSFEVTLTSCNRYQCCADTTLVFPVEILSVWFPNIFFPDAGENNRFHCHTSYEVADFELTVYNRQGLLVWETTDIDTPWDGTHGGAPVPQGAYVYRWYLKDIHGHVRTGLGTVTLVR